MRGWDSARRASTLGPPAPEVHTWAASGGHLRPVGLRGPCPPGPPAPRASHPPRGSFLLAQRLPLPSSPALPQGGDVWAWAGRVPAREKGPVAGSVTAPLVWWEAGPAHWLSASAAAVHPPVCTERARVGRGGGYTAPAGAGLRNLSSPPPSAGGRPLGRQPAGRRCVRALTRLATGMWELAGVERSQAQAWDHGALSLSSPSVCPRPPAPSFPPSPLDRDLRSDMVTQRI